MTTILREVILESADLFPDKISLQYYTNKIEQPLTYQDLKLRSLHATSILKSIGIQPGDRVILMTNNCPDAMLAFLAILMIDATAVFIDPQLTKQEQQTLFTTLDARALLVAKNFIAHIEPDHVGNLVVRQLENDFAPCAGFLSHVNLDRPKSQVVDLSVAAILFTSGTTGHLKGVTLTQQNLITAIKLGQLATETRSQDHVLSILPIHHISPLIQNIMSLSVGATLTCIEKLDGPTILAAMQAVKPTMIGVVPLILERFYHQIEEKIKQTPSINRALIRLLTAASGKISTLTRHPVGIHIFKKIHAAFGGRLTHIVCGGAALKPAIKTKLEAYGFKIVAAYGLTETAGPICATRFDQTYSGNVGIPFADHEFKISAEGEICIRGPLIMKSYFNDPESTAQVLRNGWLHTGDIGKFDHKGCLMITGRNKEMIVLSSGKKTIPTAVEAEYQAIPGVLELAVFGASQGDVGEQIYAAIVIDKNDNRSDIKTQIESAILKRGRELPAFLRIQALCFLESIPKTTTLKVKRTLLKKWAEEKHILPFFSEQTEHLADNNQLSSLETWLKEAIANKLNRPLNEIEIDQPFHYFGLDSLTAVELCNELSAFSGLDVHPALIWEHPSIRKLSTHLTATQRPVTMTEKSLPHNAINEPIAIIGMGCHFPGGITTPEKFWELLQNGQCVIQTIPKDRWQDKLEQSGHFGGFIKDIQLFDANFFEISPLEADHLDPQHRLLLEVSWEALERSNIQPNTLAGSQTGVYIGICTNDYSSLQIAANDQEITPYFGLGNSLSAAAGRIAYFLGLQGICKAIDTACSSSLVALQDAYQDLRHGLTDLAIVGGVNAILSPLASMSFNKANMLAKDGRCKVFDATADGYVRSEGCGIVVLKRLSDAKRDGNPILAVILNATVNQDGHSNGLTAPNGEAQAQLYRQALMAADLGAERLHYIEAHGTGTSLGDPIEMRSITEVYDASRSEEQPLYVGSVKSNLGHLEAAAGMAGLIKTLLILQHREIPPQIHFEQLNPLIQLKSAIQIPKSTIHLQKREQALVAAVNAFGFTGTNAHVILQEANEAVIKTAQTKPYYLLCLSAKTKSALIQKIKNLVDYVKAQPESLFELEALCYTLNSCRKHFAKRSAYVVGSREELLYELTQALALDETTLHTTVHSHEFDDNDFLKWQSLSKTAYKNSLLLGKAHYLAGSVIDWEKLHSDESRKKTVLPTYPFQRQAYWFKKSKPAMHPFLQERLYFPTIKDRIYKADLPAAWPELINDHRIFDTPIMACATFLSAILAYIARELADAHAITNFTIYEPLLLPNEQNRILEIIFSAANEERSFEIVSCDKAAHSGWTVHVKGEIHKATVMLEENLETVDAIKNRCPQIFSAETLYRTALNLGLTYGTQFKHIKEIYVGENEALGHLLPLSDSEQINGLHPGVLDSCFQVLFGIFSKTAPTELHIPTSIQHFQYTQGKLAWVYAKVNPELKTAEFHLMNAEGLILGKISGFTVKKVTQQVLQKRTAETPNLDWFYELTWQPKKVLPEENPALAAGLFAIYTPSKTLTQRLCQEFANAKIATVALQDCNQIAATYHDQPLAGIIYVPDAGSPISQMTATELQAYQKENIIPLLTLLKNLVNYKLNSFWLINTHPLLHTTLSGLFNTFLTEFPAVAGSCIELDRQEPQEVANIIANEIRHYQGERHSAYRQGVRYVERLERYVPATSKKDTLSLPDSEHYRLKVFEGGLLENLTLETVTPPEQLESTQVSLKIIAAGMNFRDVLNVLGLYPGNPGPLGGDCAGIVMAVGKDVQSVKPGDSVLGFAISGAFANFALSDEKLLIQKPTHLNFYESATLPTTFLTTYLALHHLAKLTQGENILIHAASGGVGIAAIQLAQKRGAVIFATAGNPEKRAFLKQLGVQYIYDSRTHSFAESILNDTHGNGIDVVLNSLSGKGFIEETVRVCGANARFLEIGKRDIWSKDKMAEVRPDIQYHIIALDNLIEQEPHKIKTLLTELMPEFANGTLKALPITLYGLTQASAAFRYMRQAQQIGKIILSIQQPTSKILKDASYLITGGLGDLGLQVLHYLLEKDAKTIVLLSRKAPAANLKTTLQQLEQTHQASIVIDTTDVADFTALEKLFFKFGKTLPVLKGIIHAAGTLQDKLFLEQAWIDFDKVFNAKLAGSWNLHQLTLNQELDFFVLFSSISSIFGSPGQSNYAAANAFMDGLAAYRQTLGLPALSINWGPWSAIGMAAKLEQSMTQKGITPISPERGMQLFDIAIKQTHAQLILMSGAWEKLRRGTRAYFHLLENITVSSQPGATMDSASALLLKCKLANSTERGALLQVALKECICQIAGLSINDFDVQTSFDELGLDSLMVLQLQNVLEEAFGQGILEASVINNYKTILSLATYLENRLNATTHDTPTTYQNDPEKLATKIHPTLSDTDLTQVECYMEQLTQPPVSKRLTKKIARAILWIVCKLYFKVTVKGIENLPTDRSFIICPNHTSHLDSVALGLVKRKFSHKFVGLLADNYFTKKIFPLIDLIIDVVPFNRTSDSLSLAKNLKYVELCKKANKIILLFPEGTRSQNGQLQKFKNGAAWIAEQTGLDIVPAYIEGGFRLLPRGRLIPKPGKLSITFGKPLCIAHGSTLQAKENTGWVGYQQFTQVLLEKIIDLSRTKLS